MVKSIDHRIDKSAITKIITMAYGGEISKTLPELENHIMRETSADFRHALARYPVEGYIRLLENQPQSFDYHDVSTGIRKYCHAIVHHAGDHALCLYHKLLLLRLIERSVQKLPTLNLPDEIKALYSRHFNKITEQMLANRDDFYQYSDEKFCKDLALCRLRMIPAGAVLLIQVDVSKRFLFKKGLSQFIQGASYIARELKSFGPCYQGHLDTRPDSICLAQFNPDGWRQTYKRVAELLKMHTHIKGFFGIGWFHDPVLETISPQLSFVNRLMVHCENGGRLFYNGTSRAAIEDAIFKSRTRKKLYEEGLYMPASYLFIWPRHKLIKWAEGVEKPA
jgi:hypothetical protein